MVNLSAALIALFAAFILIICDILTRLDQDHKNPSPSAVEHQPSDNQEDSGASLQAYSHRWDSEQHQHYRHERRYWCIIVIVTSLAAVGAAASAIFTWGTLQTARDTETRQLRAYLDLRPGVLTCTECNGPLSSTPEKAAPGIAPKNYVKFFAKNGGITPAYNVTLKICWWRNEVNKRLPDGFNYTCSIEPDDWSANSTIFGGTEGVFLSAVAPSDVVLARNHQITLYAYGQIEYDDGFGHSKITPLCKFYDPTGSDEHNTLWGECRAHLSRQAD
jgi:hypothetical protein